MAREPRSTTIHFVRHGQSVRFADAPDAGLTPLGERQAHATARFLAAQPVVAVYTSDTRRAQETAAIIAAACGHSPTADPRLRERAEYAPTTGMSSADFVAMWERASAQREWQPPVGDSARGCGLRMAAFVAASHAHWPGGHVVAVSHGGAIADLLLQLFTLAELAAINPALAARPYDGALLRECSVTTLSVDVAGITLLDAASATHLPG